MNTSDVFASGGRQCEASALAKALAFRGAVSPHTGAPFSEAMLFGLGGGAGFGYYVFAYGGLTTLYLNTRFMTQESKESMFHQAILDRIGVKGSYINTPNRGAAKKKLDRAVDQGATPIVWVNRSGLPYCGLREPDNAYWTILVAARDEVGYTISDCATTTRRITETELFTAAMNPLSPKFRALILESAPNAKDLTGALEDSIGKSADQVLNGWPVGRSQANTGVRGLRKWGTLLADEKDKKGWTKLFPSRRDFYARLASAYEQIELRGERGAFRNLYGEFLDEAAALLGRPSLAASASEMKQAARSWSEAAQALLPDDVSTFASMRALLDGRFDAAQKVSGGAEVMAGRLANLRKEIDDSSPLDDAAFSDVVRHASESIQHVADREEAVFRSLVEATS